MRGPEGSTCRARDHSKDVHRFTIDPNGVEVGQRLESVQAVLGWSALRTAPAGNGQGHPPLVPPG